MALPQTYLSQIRSKFSQVMNKRIAATIAAVGSIALSILPASAEVVKCDAQNNVYVAGLTPSSSTEVGFNGTFVTRLVQANRCGVIRITPSLNYANATQITLGGTASEIANLPVADPGNCAIVNGTYTSVNAPSATRFKDAIGAIYIQGLTPSSDQTVSYPDLAVTRRVTANACGYFRIASTTQSPITNSSVLKIGSVTHTVSSLGTVISPLCKKISPTQSEMMVPLSQASS